MAGAPPFGDAALVTLENWTRPPCNRWAFQHVRELIPSARIPRGDGPAWELPRAERDLGGIRFAAGSGELTVREFLRRTYTDGFLVIHRGVIVTEEYRNGLRPGTPHLLMSVSKSVTGLVAGTLAGTGALDVAAPVESVVPELAGTSFAGARVQHLLDMRAGTRFTEDYDDPGADIAVADRVYLWRPDDGKPRAACGTDYFATLASDRPHGGPFRYCSILTDVLAWVLEKAAGARFADLVSSQLWQPMGAEHDAEVTVDAHGNALADGGISATLRDAGRVGLLALRRGRGQAAQVVPAAWLDDTVAGAPDGAAAFRAGGNPAGYPPGAHYRNCWWVTDPGLPMFSASGIYGQHIFVHAPSQAVIVKLSSWPEAASQRMRSATAAAALAIAESL